MTDSYTAEEIRSRLGISTYAVPSDPFDRKGLEEIARAGISHLEILDIRDQFQEETPQTMKDIVAACRDLGLSITSFHSCSINYAQTGQAEWQKEVDRSKRMIDHLISIGGKVWGTHVLISQPQTKDAYYQLAKYYEGQDISLVVENFGPRQSVPACIEWIDSIAHPQIGMILDVGHERNTQKQNPMTIPGQPTKIIQAIGRRLVHIHLHDFIDGRDHHAPFEQTGEIQWDETFSALKEIDYQGVFMFEPRSQGDRPSDPVVKVGQVPETIAQAAG